MATNLKKNEEYILAAMAELRDTAFGLHQSFYNFCPQDFNAAKSFADELSIIAQTIYPNSASYENILPSFFYVTILFILEACNPDEWTFASIIKIARIAIKRNPEQKRIFENLINAVKDDLTTVYGKNFWSDYHYFITNSADVDSDDFSLCIKKTIEQFIDDHHLNSLFSDQLTHEIIARLNRTTSIIRHTLNKQCNSEGNY